MINSEPCIQQHKLRLCKVTWRDKGSSREKAVYVGRVWKLKENDNGITYQKNVEADLSAVVCGENMRVTGIL